MFTLRDVACTRGMLLWLQFLSLMTEDTGCFTSFYKKGKNCVKCSIVILIVADWWFIKRSKCVIWFCIFSKIKQKLTWSPEKLTLNNIQK